VGKGEFKELKNGDEIHLLREQENVSASEEIGFVFVCLIDLAGKLAKSGQSGDKRAAENVETEEQKKQREENEEKERSKKKKMDEMGEQFDCGICYDIMHQAVSLTPCVHNFCGGCFSDWL
jgi:E3 ubiquitin-protein ligase CHFR